MRLRFALVVSVAAAFALGAPATATSFTAAQIAAAKAGAQKMSELNAIVFGDASASSEIEGKAWIGGNLSMSANVAAGADANHQGFLANDGVATLTVGGDAGNGIHIKNGIGLSSVFANIGGASNGNYFDGTTGTLNAGGAITGLNGTGTGNANVAGLKSSIQAQTNTLSSNLTMLSSVLASYATNTIFNSSDPNSLSFSTSSTPNLLVANIDGSKLSTGTLTLPTLLAGQILVVNVSGDNLFMGANPGGSAAVADTQSIVWNFTGTGTMRFQNWYGSILATGATVTNSSQLNGSLVANGFTGGGEVHLGTFAGSIDTLLAGASVAAVPEPASWAMMVIGFGVIGAALRSRRQRDSIAID